MSEQEIKPFGYDWDKCPKCEGTVYRLFYRPADDLYDIVCHCKYVLGYERPADYREPKPPWEPKVGERVVDPSSISGRAGYVRHTRPTIKPTCIVWWDDGCKDTIANCDLRPETREDRERRAREIVKNAQPGDRFRVIDKPVTRAGETAMASDMILAGTVVTCKEPVIPDMLTIHENGEGVWTWNLAPLPAEPEAKKPLPSDEKLRQENAELRERYNQAMSATALVENPEIGPVTVKEAYDYAWASYLAECEKINKLEAELAARPTSEEVEAMREFFDSFHRKIDGLDGIARWLSADDSILAAYDRVLAAREGAAK